MQPGNMLRWNDICVEVNLLLKKELLEVAELLVQSKLNHT